MKLYSLSELQKMAAERFERLQVQKLFATSDGQFFLIENRARLHAGKGNVYTIHKEEASEAEHAHIDELREIANGTTSIDALRDMMMQEMQGANRQDVFEMFDTRIREILNSDKDPQFRGEATTQEPAKDIEHTVTKEDLEENPDLAASGVQEDETVTIPAAAQEPAAQPAPAQEPPAAAEPEKKAAKPAKEKAAKKNAEKKK